MLFRRWGLGGTGDLGVDNRVGDSMGSCILVDILSDGGWGWWVVVLEGGGGGLCNLLVLVVRHVD